MVTNDTRTLYTGTTIQTHYTSVNMTYGYYTWIKKNLYQYTTHCNTTGFNVKMRHQGRYVDI